MATVTLETDQDFGQGYRVCQGGEYDELALVEVYRENDPEKKPWVAYHAGFIAQGNDFYKAPGVE